MPADAVRPVNQRLRSGAFDIREVALLRADAELQRPLARQVLPAYIPAPARSKVLRYLETLVRAEVEELALVRLGYVVHRQGAGSADLPGLRAEAVRFSRAPNERLLSLRWWCLQIGVNPDGIVEGSERMRPLLFRMAEALLRYSGRCALDRLSVRCVMSELEDTVSDGSDWKSAVEARMCIARFGRAGSRVVAPPQVDLRREDEETNE
jgi:hypothetical protein